MPATPPAPAVRCARRSVRWKSTPATYPLVCAPQGAAVWRRQSRRTLRRHFARLRARPAPVSPPRISRGASLGKRSCEGLGAAHRALGPAARCRRPCPAPPGRRRSRRPMPRARRCCSSKLRQPRHGPGRAATTAAALLESRRGFSPAPAIGSCCRNGRRFVLRPAFRLEGLSRTSPRRRRTELAKTLSADDSAIPVVFDTSPCATRDASFSQGRTSAGRSRRVPARRDRAQTVLEAPPETIAVHATCSLRKAGLAPALSSWPGSARKR